MHFWGIILVVVIIISYLIYPYFPKESYPEFPDGCFENYPQNTTFKGQYIHRRFWSDKCCSTSFLPEGDFCWLKGVKE